MVPGSVPASSCGYLVGAGKGFFGAQDAFDEIADGGQRGATTFFADLDQGSDLVEFFLGFGLAGEAASSRSSACAVVAAREFGLVEPGSVLGAPGPVAALEFGARAAEFVSADGVGAGAARVIQLAA
jgi:hypothetical protein